MTGIRARLCEGGVYAERAPCGVGVGGTRALPRVGAATRVPRTLAVLSEGGWGETGPSKQMGEGETGGCGREQNTGSGNDGAARSALLIRSSSAYPVLGGGPDSRPLPL